MIGKLKRSQVVPVGKDGKMAGVLTLEVTEQNEKTGRITDKIHEFFLEQDEPGLKVLKPGQDVEVEVRPYTRAEDSTVRFQFVRLLTQAKQG